VSATTNTDDTPIQTRASAGGGAGKFQLIRGDWPLRVSLMPSKTRRWYETGTRHYKTAVEKADSGSCQPNHQGDEEDTSADSPREALVASIGNSGATLNNPDW